MASSPRELPLGTPLFEVMGARAALLRPLERLGLATVGDLLFYFPTRYDDFTGGLPIRELHAGQQVTFQAAIEDVRSFRTRRGLAVVEALLADESGSIKATWFNQPYVTTTLHAGKIANFSGKVSFSEERGTYLASPSYQIVKPSSMPDAQNPIPETQLIPVYPETQGITSRGIRFTIKKMLTRNPVLAEWIPAPVMKEFRVPGIRAALRTIHFPNTIEEAQRAQRRFAFENLFLLQLANAERKLKLGERQAPAIAPDVGLVKKILAGLPFALTPSQKRSLWEIMQDMAKARPMNRLLQGDVGSGKTIVAAIAAMTAARQGAQVAFMAPTEILAQQHYATLRKLLHDMPQDDRPTVGIVTGAATAILYPDGLESKMPKKKFHAMVADGAIAVVFGTHALIQKSVAFRDLGLVIVDEQHRFGVRQRAQLAGNRASGMEDQAPKERPTSDARNPKLPHFLSMSATPIPRTLMLTVFGDLDLSLITELPAGRKPIETRIVAPQERKAAYDFVRREIRKGRQAFVICPRIEALSVIPAQAEAQGQVINMPSMGSRLRGNDRKNPSESLSESKSVKEEYEKLSKKVFPELRIAMLHGQMKPAEKEAVMRGFKDRRHDILVATSVVEVGVDVPNATVMMIEGAERFGLAQLYQFRGRVGRGEHQSHCLLMSSSDGTTSANARLMAILKAKNGFELAEYDLKLRGPGQFFGDAAQTGFPDALMKALQNPELVKQSREAAEKIMRIDPGFLRHAPLKSKLGEFEKQIHQE